MPDEFTRKDFELEFAAYLQQSKKKRPQPIVMSRKLDVWLFYWSVQRRGGYSSVMQANSWRQVFLEACDAITYSSNTGYYCRLAYEKSMLDYERTMRKMDPDRLRKFDQIDPAYDENEGVTSTEVIRRHKELVRERSMDNVLRPHSPRQGSPKYDSQGRRRHKRSMLANGSSGEEDYMSDDEEAYDMMTNDPEKWEKTYKELEDNIEKLGDVEEFVTQIELEEPAVLTQEKADFEPEDLKAVEAVMIKLQQRYKQYNDLLWQVDRRIGAHELKEKKEAASRRASEASNKVEGSEVVVENEEIDQPELLSQEDEQEVQVDEDHDFANGPKNYGSSSPEETEEEEEVSAPVEDQGEFPVPVDAQTPPMSPAPTKNLYDNLHEKRRRAANRARQLLYEGDQDEGSKRRRRRLE